MLHRITPLIVSFLFSIQAFSQNKPFTETKVKFKDRNYFARVNYQFGPVLPTNDFISGKETGQPITQFNSFSIELGRQTDGSKEWHHTWSKPYYGIGYYQADYGRDNDLGQPAALYTFFGTPLKRWKKFGLFVEAGIGLTWNWKPYQAEVNPFNVAIGSYNTVYIDAGLKGLWQLGEKVDLMASYTFTHFSNGATSLPNSGINQTGLRIGVGYNFQNERPSQDIIKLPKFEKEHEISVSARVASKQVKFDTSITKLKTQYLGLNYGYAGFDVTYNYKITRYFKTGASLDIGYDGSTTAQLDVVDSVYNPVTVPDEYHILLAGYYTLGAQIDRVELYAQLGYYLWRKDIPGQTPAFHQRIMLRLRLYKGLFFTGGLRAYNFGIADHIEWGLGYKF